LRVLFRGSPLCIPGRRLTNNFLRRRGTSSPHASGW
jgi:hypothetical protein